MSATPYLALTLLLALSIVARGRDYLSTGTSLLVLTGMAAILLVVFRLVGL